MTDLPSRHPSLSLHLTDRALTPIISSGDGPSAPSPAHNAGAGSDPRLAALTALSSTALAAHDAAKRWGMGSPLRIMVEYGGGGGGPGGGGTASPPAPLLLSSFLCPMSLLVSSDAARRPGTAASSSSSSSSTASTADGVPVTSPADALLRLDGPGRPDPGGPGAGDEEEDPNGPPMLVGLVVAPDGAGEAAAASAAEARRAAARLERVARTFQAEWIAEQRAAEASGAGPGEARGRE